MIKKQRLQGIFIGAIGMFVLLTSVTAFAEPIYKQISVNIGGIKVFLDGQQIQPKDANGKEVEPLIYEGTTYLPVRAITNALTNNQKSIEWDDASSTVYLGKRPSGKVVSIQDLKPIVGVENYTPYKDGFEVSQKRYVPADGTLFNDFVNKPSVYIKAGIHPIATYDNNVYKSPTYLLDHKYSKLSGSLAIQDKVSPQYQLDSIVNITEKGNTVLKVYINDPVNGEFKPIYTSAPVAFMVAPIRIDVDLPETADQMYFTLESNNNEFSYPAHFFNIQLTES